MEYQKQKSKKSGKSLCFSFVHKVMRQREFYNLNSFHRGENMTTAESKEKNMDKKEQEKQNEKQNKDKFNTITQSVKPENQNQTHNVRKEGIGPINQKR